MKQLIFIFLFIPSLVFGQRIVPVSGVGKSTDTLYDMANMRIDGGIRLLSFKTEDPSYVLGTDANGNVVFRQVASTEAFLQVADSATKYITHFGNDTGKANIYRVVDSAFTTIGDSTAKVRQEIGYVYDALDDSAAAIRAAIPSTSSFVHTSDTTAMLTPYLRAYLGVKYTDTANMLAAYMRRADTITLSNRINLKLNFSDSSAMLGPYLRKADTAAMLSTYLRSVLGVKYTDTSAILGPYLRKADTATLSNRINLKVNYADTASMILPYLRKTDTVAMLSPYLRKGDTALMLTPYLKKSDSSIYSTKAWRQKLADSIGANFLTPSNSAIVTNKIWVPLIDSITTATPSYTPNCSNFQASQITGLANSLLINAMGGTARHGQVYVFDFNDNGSGQTISWNAIYRGSFPTTTTIGKTTTIVAKYNSKIPSWDFMFSKTNP